MQDQKGNWLEFAQAERSLVDVNTDEQPLPYGTGHPNRLKRIVDSLQVNRVLDLGCNAAIWSPIFGDSEYHGLDQEEGMLPIARANKPDGIFTLGMGETLPYEDSFFDLVFTSHVLQHNTHFPEKDQIVREIRRVLKTNGFYLCIENTGSDAKLSDKSFTVEGWVSFIFTRGFSLLGYWPAEEFLFRKDSKQEFIAGSWSQAQYEN